MRIVYFGSGAFGLPTLERLSNEHQLVGVVTQPDRPAGRRKTLTPTPVGEWASAGEATPPIFKPDRAGDRAHVEAIRAVEADAWVVIAFGQKLTKELLTDRFAINLHASLLPRWRGAAPINHAILAGDTETGNSVISLAERMDAGLIYGQSRRPIDPLMTAGELHDALAADGPDLVLRVLDEQARGVARGREQDESQVTLASKLTRADGWIDFAEGAEACRRRIHGLTPWPGVAVRFRDAPLKIARVQVVEGGAKQEVPGAVVDAEEGIVACGGGSGLLRIIEIQPAGKRKMGWPEFARGRRVQRGERIEGGRAC